MPELTLVIKERWANYVSASVGNVARRYIASNGLGDLELLKNGKFIVAQEVFKTLNEAMDHPFVPRFPTFDHIKIGLLRSVTQSLLDINVEERAEGFAFTSGESIFSVSITPAITIVLAEFLCENPPICWNWQGLEAFLALGEWKSMITHMEASEFTSSFGIRSLWSPIPDETEARFSLPLVGRTTVLVNGPAAPYAVVMAPFRLVQAKFSSKTKENLKLDFETEMSQMGLTNDPAYRLQQAVTSVLYVMWSERGLRFSKGRTGKCSRLGGCKDEVDGQDDDVDEARCEHYPYQTLFSDCTPALKTASFTIEDENPNVLPDDGDVEATELIKKRQIKVWEEFTSQYAVTAVFVTNAKTLVFGEEEPVVQQVDPTFQEVGPAVQEEEPAFQEEQPVVDDLEPTEKRAKQEQFRVEEGQREQTAGEQLQPGKEEHPRFTIGRDDVATFQEVGPAVQEEEFAFQEEQPVVDDLEPDEKRAKPEQLSVEEGQQNQPTRKRKQSAGEQLQPGKEEQLPFTIGRDDVDWQGVLKVKQLPDYLVCNLRQNVKVRFLFY